MLALHHAEGTLQKKLCKRLESFADVSWFQLDIDVIAELHLISPKHAAIKTVTSDNYQECFSLIAQSVVFHFTDLLPDSEGHYFSKTNYTTETPIRNALHAI